MSLCSYLACLEVAENYLWHERASSSSPERGREQVKPRQLRTEELSGRLVARLSQILKFKSKRTLVLTRRLLFWFRRDRSITSIKAGATGKTSSKFNARTFGDSWIFGTKNLSQSLKGKRKRKNKTKRIINEKQAKNKVIKIKKLQINYKGC